MVRAQTSIYAVFPFRICTSLHDHHRSLGSLTRIHRSVGIDELLAFNSLLRTSHGTAAFHGTVTIGGETIYDEFYSTAGGSRFLEFDYSIGDSLVIAEAGQCIVDVYSIQVATIVPQPVNSFDWVVLSTFGKT